MVKIKILHGGTMTVNNSEYHRIVNMFYQDRELVHEKGLLKLFIPATVVNSFLKHGI